MDLKALDESRVQYLGKKGELTDLLKGLGKLSKEERPKMGEAINEAKVQIQKLIESRKEELRKPSSHHSDAQPHSRYFY